MGNKVQIQNITDHWKEHSASLYSLIEKVYKSSDYFCDSFEDKYPSFNFFQKELETQLPNALYLGAFQATKLVGYLILNPQKPIYLRHTSFFSMGVDNKYRGMGVGGLLVDGMIKQRDPSIEIIYLMVRFDNKSAIRLYEKFNFSKVTLLEKDTKIGSKYFDGLMMKRSFI